MNPPETAPEALGWSLEVIRGRRPGQVFPLSVREMILGTAATPPTVGIDLAGQEGPASRRMAGHHAILTWPGLAPAIRDLDTSCGTFVNRLRVPTDRAWPLRPNDEVQLGSVVLRLVGGETGTNSPTDSQSDTFSYVFGDGLVCHSWDDFLAVGAHHWRSLRDELASGRIDTFLVGIGRDDLLPRSAIAANADDRLDAWLAGLPTTRPNRPELDVHPARVVVRASPEGGTVRRSARVANLGVRLLRCTARVEPEDSPWLRLAPEFADIPFAAVAAIDLGFDVAVPDGLRAPLSAEVVVEGNGGTARVIVVVDPRGRPGMVDPEPSPAAGAGGLRAILARFLGRGR